SPSCPASAKNSSRKAPIRSFSSPLTTSSRWCSNRSRNLSIRSGSCCGSRPKARWAIVSATVCPKNGSFANTPLAQFFSAKSLICSRLPACLIDTNVSLPYFSARSNEGRPMYSPETGSGMSEVRIARRRSSSSAGEFVADVERGRARHLREGAGAHGEDHELAGRTGGFVEELRVRVEAGGRIDDLAHVLAVLGLHRVLRRRGDVRRGPVAALELVEDVGGIVTEFDAEVVDQFESAL